MALKSADKKIVDAFTDGVDEIGEGPRSSFSVRGGVLRGPAGSRLAEQGPGGKIVWIGTGGTRYQDDTYRYLKKTVPKNKFVGHGMQPNRSGRRAQFGFVHDARTHDFLRPASREDMLKSLRTSSGEYSEGGRRVYVRNGRDPLKLAAERSRAQGGKRRPMKTYKDIIHESERDRYPFDYAVRNGSTSDEDWANEQILRGIVLGFWLQGWAYAMEEAGLPLPRNITEETAPYPPDELTDFAMKFAQDLSESNGNRPLFDMAWENGVTLDDDLELFGYYLAMESLGHGVSWSDDHGDHGLKIPSTEVLFDFDDPEGDDDSWQVVYAESSKRLAR